MLDVNSPLDRLRVGLARSFALASSSSRRRFLLRLLPFSSKDLPDDDLPFERLGLEFPLRLRAGDLEDRTFRCGDLEDRSFRVGDLDVRSFGLPLLLK